MTVCNATVGNLSSLLLGRLELRHGWGRKGNVEGRGQDGHSLGGCVGKPEQSDHVSKPGGLAEPGQALPWGGGERVCSQSSGCRCLPGLVFSQLLRKFYIPGRHRDPERSVTGWL